jgi:hypothetical protein
MSTSLSHRTSGEFLKTDKVTPPYSAVTYLVVAHLVRFWRPQTNNSTYVGWSALIE